MGVEEQKKGRKEKRKEKRVGRKVERKVDRERGGLLCEATEETN